MTGSDSAPVLPQNRACPLPLTLRFFLGLETTKPDDLTHFAFCSVGFRSEGETVSLG